MRFFLLMLATAAFGVACEKDLALSNTTQNLVPTAAVAPAAVTIANPGGANPGMANAAGAVPSGVVPAAVAPGGVAPGGVAPGGVAPGGVSPSVPAAASERGMVASPPPSARASDRGTADKAEVDEGNGEPMDDVDDEVVPVTDKSGVDNRETEEGPSGPVDEDSEGADIDLRE